MWEDLQSRFFYSSAKPHLYHQMPLFLFVKGSGGQTGKLLQDVEILHPECGWGLVEVCRYVKDLKKEAGPGGGGIPSHLPES